MEKGLSTAFVCLALVGMAADWLLKRQFGECPDEVCDTRLLTRFYCELIRLYRNGTAILHIMRRT
jgi:hypothetical protein